MTETKTELPQEAAATPKKTSRRKAIPAAAQGTQTETLPKPSVPSDAAPKKRAVRRKAPAQAPEEAGLLASVPHTPADVYKAPRKQRTPSVKEDSSKEENFAAKAPAPKPPRKKSAASAENLTAVAAPTANTQQAEPAKKSPRSRQKKTQEPAAETLQPSSAAPHAPAPAVADGDGYEVWRPRDSRRAAEPQEPSGPPVEAARKPYPVYVPLHIAKQMEQEGKPAPLAVDANAQQAAAIRAAAHENRHAPHPQHAQSQRHENAPRQHQQSQQSHQAPERRDRAPHEQGYSDAPRQDARPGERSHDRHDRHDRKRGRNDRRRGDRRDDSSNSHDRPQSEGRNDGRHDARHDGRQDSSRELPPPTPDELFPGEGIIEISGKGFGFLRDPQRNFAQSPADIFVSPEMVRRFNLRDGQWIKGTVRKSGRGQQMHEIESVNGDEPSASCRQPMFDELTVINPNEPLMMATTPERYTTRVLDMIAPIGKGQRGLIVAQPRTGKTTLLQHIADAMMKNHPEVKLIMLLVDERPEEVTEIRHTVPNAEIMASSNDMDVRSHTRIAELAIDRAKRLVESGRDVFILLDSITRLGRAFNNALTNGGRTMSGGMDARAMEMPRKLFAAARNTEEAGSLTIIATALIDTGSRMDEIIFQEFKGTGNMELVLDRKVAEQRIYPAVDIFQSGTRREELLIPADTLQKIHFLRRGLSGCRPLDAIERLLFYLKKFPTNEQMLREIRA